ncbi:nucleotidyltransferase domain-containing protein [Taibaiella koreensis]|uniref:nucleotidyltransferase domain-containing protein n=1 Tax=Taibaiella koreensis TaxID=1268548 RepID=UPI000E59DD18|nr:nucleotidyltransferase domain-containing protein [Taibaiella koreensis]
MNIIINQTEHEWLQARLLQQYLIGSRLYGTAREDSDQDYLCIYESDAIELYSGLPNAHQFLYKEEATNTDWNYCSQLQFYKNLHSGETTIHADIILFTGMVSNPMEQCRTYKIIKAYLGFARRDLKQCSKERPEKLFHAARSLYCAGALLGNTLPTVAGIQTLFRQRHDASALDATEQQYRARANELYEKGQLEQYYIESAGNPLWQKLLDSNNQREFRY